MAKEKLDRSRPFGEVHGGAASHVYEQDGINFDHQGHQVGHGRRQVAATAPEAVSELEELRAENARLRAEKDAGPHEDSDNPPLTDMGVKQLQAEHKRRTGEGFPTGTKQPQMVEILQQMRDAEALASNPGGSPPAA